MKIISISSFENYFGFIVETVRGIHEMCTCTYVLIHKVDGELYSHTRCPESCIATMKIFQR